MQQNISRVRELFKNQLTRCIGESETYGVLLCWTKGEMDYSTIPLTERISELVNQITHLLQSDEYMTELFAKTVLLAMSSIFDSKDPDPTTGEETVLKLLDVLATTCIYRGWMNHGYYPEKTELFLKRFRPWWVLEKSPSLVQPSKMPDCWIKAVIASGHCHLLELAKTQSGNPDNKTIIFLREAVNLQTRADEYQMVRLLKQPKTYENGQRNLHRIRAEALLIELYRQGKLVLPTEIML